MHLCTHTWPLICTHTYKYIYIQNISKHSYATINAREIVKRIKLNKKVLYRFAIIINELLINRDINQKENKGP